MVFVSYASFFEGAVVVAVSHIDSMNARKPADNIAVRSLAQRLHLSCFIFHYAKM